MKSIQGKVLLALVSGVFAGAAHAERADSLKQVVIDANAGSLDQVNGTSVVSGNVVLTRGTLVIKAEKATVREDDEGYYHVTFLAPKGGKATFRQKRDGGPDLWSEGEAERIEYDGKNEVVKFFSKAHVASLDGNRVTDQADGPYISYDSRREFFELQNTAEGKPQPGGGRVQLILDHKPKGPAAAPAPADQGKK
ncbi:MAG: lipopolysaccharide transport periplasmic protein LptA [Telluria sp.]